MLTGSCHCGAVKYEITGPISRFAYCHCDDCRKISGAAYSSALVLDAAGFRITAGADQLTPYQSSPGKFRNFCRTCGSHIYARMDNRPGLVIIRAGTLDAAPGLAPQMHVWVKGKAPWYEIRDSLPQYQEGYVAK